MYHSCTIWRIIERRYGHLAIGTDEEIVWPYESTVTEHCNTPLFTDAERQSGICRSCRKGWHTSGNEFYDESERQRAMSS